MKLVQISVILVSAALVASYPMNIDSENKAEESNDEYGEYFEGDMLLTAKQLQAVNAAMDRDESRNGLRNTTYRWPNNTVVYWIVEDDFDEEQIQKIEYALEDIANKSCLKFHKRDHEDDHAVIIQGSKNGCFSRVGFHIQPDEEDDDPQVLNLAKGCFRHGTIVHEMLHTLGFYHMQSSFDRNDYVKIIWENIESGHEHNFEKYDTDTVTNFGVPYDYGSVMHYSATAFSKNGNATIVPLQENVELGQRMGMSKSDIVKLNKMYCSPEETE